MECVLIAIAISAEHWNSLARGDSLPGWNRLQIHILRNEHLSERKLKYYQQNSECLGLDSASVSEYLIEFSDRMLSKCYLAVGQNRKGTAASLTDGPEESKVFSAQVDLGEREASGIIKTAGTLTFPNSYTKRLRTILT
jgi:hypothetical protein